jgi:hypothetical protein
VYVDGQDLVAIIWADFQREVTICSLRMLWWLMIFGRA